MDKHLNFEKSIFWNYRTFWPCLSWNISRGSKFNGETYDHRYGCQAGTSPSGSELHCQGYRTEIFYLIFYMNYFLHEIFFQQKYALSGFPSSKALHYNVLDDVVTHSVKEEVTCPLMACYLAITCPVMACHTVITWHYISCHGKSYCHNVWYVTAINQWEETH